MRKMKDCGIKSKQSMHFSVACKKKIKISARGKKLVSKGDVTGCVNIYMILFKPKRFNINKINLNTLGHTNKTKFKVTIAGFH